MLIKAYDTKQCKLVNIAKNLDKEHLICIEKGCQGPMIPVTGKIKAWHFRHKYEGDIDRVPHESKSEEHWYLQNKIFLLLSLFGLEKATHKTDSNRKLRTIDEIEEGQVDTEVIVYTPDSVKEYRRADILLKYKGKVIVFEVQWSHQSDENYEQRQKDYLQNGVDQVYWVCKELPDVQKIPLIEIEDEDIYLDRYIISLQGVRYKLDSFVKDFLDKELFYKKGKWYTRVEWDIYYKDLKEKLKEESEKSSIERTNQKYLNKNKERLAIEREELVKEFNKSVKQYWALLPYYKKQAITRKEYTLHLISLFEEEGYPANTEDYENYQIQAITSRIKYHCQELSKYI